MKTSFWVYCTISILIATWQPAHAGEGEWRTYTVADGLAGSGVKVIFQDSKGYLWLGTCDGVSRFDGVQFDNFTEADGLPFNCTTQIREDPRGDIWFLTEQSVSRYDGSALHPITEEEGLAGGYSEVIFLDSKGNLWFANEGGATRYDGTEFQTLGTDVLKGKIQTIFEDSQGHLWFAGTSIFRYDGRTFQPVEAKLSEDALIRLIEEDSVGNLWFAGDAVLMKFDGETFESFSDKQDVPEFPGGGTLDLGTKSISLIHIFPEGSLRYEAHARERGNWGGSVGQEERFFVRVFGILTDSIFKDSRGVLWFNDNGFAAKWDGKTFRPFIMAGNWEEIQNVIPEETYNEKLGYFESAWFKYQSERQPEQELKIRKAGLLPGTVVMEDEDRNLWLLGKQAVYLYDGVQVKMLFTLEEGLENTPILTFFKDREGNFWFGHDRGVTIYNPHLNFHNIRPEADLGKNHIVPLFEDSQQNVWFSVKRGNGIARYDGEKLHYFSDEELKENSPKRDLFISEDGKGGLWIFGSSSESLFHYNGKHFRNISLLETDVSTHVINASISGDVFRPTVDTQGNLWVARYHDLVKVHPQPVIVERLQVTPEALLRPKYGEFFGVTFDELTRRVTAVTEGSPMARAGVKVGDIPIRDTLQTDPAGVHPPGFPGVKIIFKVNRNGTELHLETELLEKDFLREKVETYVEAIDNRYTHLDIHPGFDYGFGWASAIHSDRLGNIWVAIEPTEDFPGGVIRYDGENARLFNTADGLADNHIVGIFEDNASALWFATVGGAVSRYDGNAFQNFRIEALHGNESPEMLVAIRQDAKGGVWFIYGEAEKEVVGIASYDGEHFVSLKAEDALAERLKASSIQDALIDNQGHLWLATNRGAIRYDGEQFTAYSRKDGLPVNELRDIEEDSKGRLWFATWGGGVVVTDGETFQNISTHDGLVADRVTQILADSRGQLWFGTAEGLSRYTPPAQRFPPFIHIRQVVADDVYTDARRIRVPASVKRIHIEYQGISFKSRRLRYRYKLEGYDKNWTTTWETECDYVKLPPGEYTFKVVAVNQDLVASESSAQVVLTVLPPFYKRLGFILPVSTGTVLILLFMFDQRRTIAKLTRRLFSAEEKIRQRTAELQQAQAKLIQSEKMATVGTLAGGVAHEINNPMDAILGSVQRILRFAEEPKIVESAQSAEEGARRCKGIVEKLLKYARQSSDEFTVLEVNQVIEDTVALLGHQLKLDNISLQMQLSSELKIEGNFTELSQVLTNLLINAKDAIFAARSEGKEAGVITVRTAAKNDEIFIEVSDDGTGIAEADLGKLFDPFFTTKPVGKGTGLGLSICQGIVEKHQGRIEVESEIGNGATFRVFLPMIEA